MILASTLSTVEAVIPYVILVGVLVFFGLRLLGSLVDRLERERKHRDEHKD